jgi:hypothetical protein
MHRLDLPLVAIRKALFIAAPDIKPLRLRQLCRVPRCPTPLCRIPMRTNLWRTARLFNTL